MFGRGNAGNDNDRHLPGKWTVRAFSRPAAIWTNCTEVVVYANGPWISFRDSRGDVRFISARAELIPEPARPAPEKNR